MRFVNRSSIYVPLPSLGNSSALWGIPCLEDNLAWALVHGNRDGDRGVLLIDVPEAGPVKGFLEKEGLVLDRILLTHGHWDHTAGLEDLLRTHRAETWADARLGIAGAHALPADGQTFSWKGIQIRVLDTSGHSDCDVSFYLASPGLCFCGDTLFAGGCGRVFAGPPERMWQSLLRLRNLPDDTTLCFGHDYARENYLFARQTFPGFSQFTEALERVQAEDDAGRIYAPVTVGEQSRCNPMLMADYPEIAGALGMKGQPPEEVFAEIRSQRSAF